VVHLEVGSFAMEVDQVERRRIQMAGTGRECSCGAESEMVEGRLALELELGLHLQL
jgi:hypothetical protein